MARRRLLTILAASAVLGAALAGPAAATELVAVGGEPVTEVADGALPVTEQAVEEAVEEVVGSTVGEPVADAAAAIVEVVAPEPSPSASPAPSPAPSEEPAATGDDDAGETLVAAGDVTAAPSLAFLTGTGGTAPGRQARLDVPSPAPAAVAAPAHDEVQAPQVAPAPAAITDVPTPSALAQAVTRAAGDEGTPVVVLVAIASLLAAGFGTVRGARTAAA